MLRHALVLLVLFAGVLTVAPHAAAQSPAPAGVASAAPTTPNGDGDGDGDEDDRGAVDSPRAAVAAFLELTRASRYAEAARYLDLAPTRAGAGPGLARRLRAVLDRHLGFDLARVSPVSAGRQDDELPPWTDEVARVPTEMGASEGVRVVRRKADGGRWVFARSTVNRIDAWYDALEHRWALDYLPEPLLRPGPRALLYWQWLALPVLVVFAWLTGFALAWVTRRLGLRLSARTVPTWDDAIFKRIGSPLTLAWGLVIAYLALPWLGLYGPAEDFLHRMLRAGGFFAFFWALSRTVDVLGQSILASPWTVEHPAARALVPLGARVGKFAVFAIAVIALLSELGYPVTSLVAGLGIGGLAIALAAQKTVENLFGAFSIGADQPFRQGDLVKIEDFIATVEQIGLRSTRFRTLGRTLITIPNGRLAEMRIESYAARDRMQLHCILGLVYDTSSVQLRAIVTALEAMLAAHPQLAPDGHYVRLIALGQSSLDVEVMAWFGTADVEVFRTIQQELLLTFVEAVEHAGTKLAFPTRTVHLVGKSS